MEYKCPFQIVCPLGEECYGGSECLYACEYCKKHDDHNCNSPAGSDGEKDCLYNPLEYFRSKV